MKRNRVGRVEDVPANGPLLVMVGNLSIGVYRVGDTFKAWRNSCPHMDAPVCRGTVAGTNLPSGVYEYVPGRQGEILQCPWHGWEFDLVTGEHLVESSRSRLRGYPVEVQDGELYVLTSGRS